MEESKIKDIINRYNEYISKDKIMEYINDFNLEKDKSLVKPLGIIKKKKLCSAGLMHLVSGLITILMFLILIITIILNFKKEEVVLYAIVILIIGTIASLVVSGVWLYIKRENFNVYFYHSWNENDIFRKMIYVDIITKNYHIIDMTETHITFINKEDYNKYSTYKIYYDDKRLHNRFEYTEPYYIIKDTRFCDDGFNKNIETIRDNLRTSLIDKFTKENLERIYDIMNLYKNYVTLSKFNKIIIINTSLMNDEKDYNYILKILSNIVIKENINLSSYRICNDEDFSKFMVGDVPNTLILKLKNDAKETIDEINIPFSTKELKEEFEIELKLYMNNLNS